MTKRLTKTTYRQYEEMLNFLVDNKILLYAKSKPTETKRINNLWIEFSNYINELGYGAQKTSTQWRHVFNEWKTNTRRKSREIQKEMTGSGPGTKSLTDLEQRLLSLINFTRLEDIEVSDSMELQTSDAECSHQGPSKIELEIPFYPESFNGSGDVVVHCIENATDPLTDHKYLLEEEEEDIKEVADRDVIVYDTVKQNMPTPKTVKSQRQFRKSSNNNSRNLILNATKTYENVQKMKMETERNRANAISNLSRSLDCYTEVYRRQERAKLKLEYFKQFQSFDGFEELYK